MDEDDKKLPKKFKLPGRLGAIKTFFDAATNLINRGVSKEGIINFAKQEFGEVSDLMLARINQLFRKQESGTLEQTRREPIGQEGNVIEGIEFSIPSQGIIRQKGTADEIMNYLSTNPYRKGGPLDPNTGMTRTAARDILRRLLDEGKITIPNEAERDAIAKGYQGGVDPIVVFEKVFGRENLQDLSELADEMNRAGDYTELQNILKRENLYGLKQKDKYELDPGGMTDDELRELLKKIDVDPDDTGFARGGRVGYSDGNEDPKKKLIKKIPIVKRVGKIASGIEALQPAIRKIMDKFGTDAITTADKIEQPPKKTEVLAREFEARERGRNETQRLMEEAEGKFAKPKPGKMEMKGIGTITTNTDFAASLKDPKLFDPDAKNIYGDKVKTGDKFYSEMETLYTNMIARKKREMPDRSNPNYGLLQSSLKDAEDSLEAIKITRALGGNENMFDKLRTSNLGLGRGDKRRPVEFSNYVDLPPPGSRGGPDDIAAPVQSAEESIENMIESSDKLTPKMIERFKLKEQYPGLDEDIITGIVDADPDSKAQIISTLEQILELHRQGKSPAEAADIIGSTIFKGRKDNAEGGLNYLMGM